MGHSGLFRHCLIQHFSHCVTTRGFALLHTRHRTDSHDADRTQQVRRQQRQRRQHADSRQGDALSLLRRFCRVHSFRYNHRCRRRRRRRRRYNSRPPGALVTAAQPAICLPPSRCLCPPVHPVRRPRLSLSGTPDRPGPTDRPAARPHTRPSETPTPSDPQTTSTLTTGLPHSLKTLQLRLVQPAAQ